MKIAAFTWILNNDPYIKVWLKYYNQFGFDIFVINASKIKDHKEFDRYGVKVTELTRGDLYAKNEDGKHNKYEDLLFMAHAVQKRILKDYDYFVFSDIDEIIVTDPDKYKDLGEYMEKLDKDTVTCTGRQVLQSKDEESLDLDKPILGQRNHWWPHIAEWKTGISRIPLEWVSGFHYTLEIREGSKDSGIDQGSYIKSLADKGLYMVHLKTADEKILFDRENGALIRRERSAHMGDCKEIPERFKGQL